MPVEFIGYIGNHNASETIARSGPVIDRDHIAAAAAIHENGGFDRVLLAFHSTSPESILVAQHVTERTRNLKLMIAHRPGFTAPTLAARQLATLDHLSDGRISVHIITGGNDRELAQDGDHLTKDERYERTSEYLDIVRQEWTSAKPFDYEGKYYRVTSAFSEVKPQGPDGIPVYFGGSSEAAIAVAGKHADIYALWGETLAQVGESIRRVREAAAPNGRSPRFSLSLRPILADTEEEAWAKAGRILERAKALRASSERLIKGNSPAHQPANEGSRRLLAAAAQGARLDKRLWTEIAALTGASGNSTSLVGTPDQVAEAMLDYYDLGITTFLIRGFDPLEDAFHYGRDLIPRVRALVAERDNGVRHAEAAE
ncbi:LLM class flavin-dependent oxidoreductase [Mesorhizobium sp. LHD-90]|uniref:LLM class flavin-dependent oxidoreductase n=1 Tax=Mesorhizobium sp. LHD-90 TaxID=3071414 RepID=UPI0027E04A4D|nr:LLM class flavin-dependent oxidoreductase [Mesorhizobium sp. LHD-90]MDQ6433894.1 LLM class flavin-dependent oxidoreductase [Mesorhizobium sp. LHD-90]